MSLVPGNESPVPSIKASLIIFFASPIFLIIGVVYFFLFSKAFSLILLANQQFYTY